MGVTQKRGFLVHTSEEVLKTGAVAPETGIYRVVHTGHRLPHEVVILQGQRFPRCSKCTSSVLFELAHAAPDLFQSCICRIYELPVVEHTQPREQEPTPSCA